MKRYKRRDFIALSAIALGAATIPNCTGKQDTIITGGPNETFSAEEISLNRKMPRKLLMRLLDQKVDKYMAISNNCSQSTYLTLKEQFGLKDNGIVKALTALPGIAERGETCGTVTGSLMALGLIYGRGEERLNDFKAYQDSLIPSGKFCKLFEEEFGSTMCCDIQKLKYGRCYHLTEPDDLAAFQAAGATEKCSEVVKKSVQICADIILTKPVKS